MPPDGIRTSNPSRRAAADTRLRPLGHWDRPFVILAMLKLWILLKSKLSWTQSGCKGKLSLAKNVYLSGQPGFKYVYETKTTLERKKYFHLFPFRYKQVSLHDNVEWLISYLVCLLVNASARYSNYFKKRFVGEFVLHPRVREVTQQYFC